MLLYLCAHVRQGQCIRTNDVPIMFQAKFRSM
jgi:hypothetical protein